VAVRELRSKQRPVWERWLSIAGAVVIGCGPAPMLMLTTHDLFTGHLKPSDARAVFDVLNIVAAWVLTVLIAVPAAIGIVSEREKRTLEPLRATALQPGDVVGGKIIGAMAAGLPILGLVIPMQLWAVVLGGVGVFQWLGMLLLLVGVAFWAACVGTAVSAASASAVSAIVVTFVVIGVLGTGATLLPNHIGYYWEWAAREDNWVATIAIVAWIGLLVLWLPVAHRVIGRARRPLAVSWGHLAGAVALVLVAAILLSEAIVAAHPHEGSWLPAAFYPPIAVAAYAPINVPGVDWVPAGKPLFWAVSVLLSLLSSAFFHSIGAIIYERRTR